MIRRLSLLTWFVILLLFEATLAVVLPPNPGTLHLFNITAATYHLSIAALIPQYAVIWFAAFYAYDKLDRYSKKLHTAEEGAAFLKLSRGIGIIAWWFAVPSLITLIFEAEVVHHPGIRATGTIINNYVALGIPLIAFSLIGNGAHQLAKIAKARPSRLGLQLFIVMFIIIGVFFVQLITHNQDINNNPYYLSRYPLLITLIIPYLYTWAIGLMSAYELWLYANKAKGVLYKSSIARLANGMIIVVFASIAGQFLTSVHATKANNISLGTLLIWLYGLLAVQAGGYALIAFGAKQLRKIEEV